MGCLKQGHLLDDIVNLPIIRFPARQTIFLPVIGLVDPAELKPGDLVGVNKDSYLILDTLPAEYDSRVKAMEVRKSSESLGCHSNELHCIGYF